MLTLLLIVLFIICSFYLIGIGNRRVLKKYANVLWTKMVQPLFKHYFVLTEQKLLLSFFKTIAGVSGLSIVVNIVVKTKWFEARIGYDGAFDIFIVLIDLIILVGYALYIFCNYKSKLKKNHNNQTISNVVERAKEVSKNLVEINIKSGKYIPETYLEVNEYKDAVRFFCDPVLFHGLAQDRALRLNFDHINTKWKLEGKGKFVYNFVPVDNSIINLSNIVEISKRQVETLDTDIEKLNVDGNEGWMTSRKVDRVKKEFYTFINQFCLITSDAGHGKTNFLCDLVQKTLLPRGIPTLYVNAFQLSSDDIAGNLSSILYPFDSIPFSDILDGFESYCLNKDKPLVIIIDGLNENPKVKTFASSLQRFLQEISKYSFVRIVLTCRTQYYEHNFSELLKQFENKTLGIPNLFSRLEDDHKERILNNYLSYFHINVRFSDDIKKQLTENFLLLRIFSEAYHNKSLGVVGSLYKAELFQAYYDTMSDKINAYLQETSGLGGISIKSLFGKIVEQMVSTDQFMNVPLDNLLSVCSPDEKIVYSRFLDENILLRKDLVGSETKNVFSDQEVVNFTYDEFRDFLISEYLIGVVYKNSKDDFTSTCSRLTGEKSIASEGLRTFLFLVGHKDSKVLSSLSKNLWYEKTFINQIWSVPDHEVTHDDIKHIRQVFPVYTKVIIHKLVCIRWNVQVYPILNINLILDILKDKDQYGIMKIFNTSFDYSVDRFYYRETEQAILLDSISDLLESERISNNPIAIAPLMEFILYLTTFNTKSKAIYMEYYNKYHNIEQLEKVKKTSKCRELTYLIESKFPLK